MSFDDDVSMNSKAVTIILMTLKEFNYTKVTKDVFVDKRNTYVEDRAKYIVRSKTCKLKLLLHCLN